MLDVIFAGFVNSTIACDSMLPKDPGLAALNGREHVESKICDFFSSSYEHVKLTPLKVTAKEITDIVDAKKLYEPAIEAPLAGRVKITWDIKLDDGQVKQLNAIYSLEAFKKVPVFKRSFTANHELSEEDVDYKEVNVGPYLGLKSFQQGSISGKMLLKKVTKGSYVFDDAVAESALIKINDEISLVVRSGGLKISTLAIALENGYKVNSNIKVRVKETGAVVSANIQFEKNAYVEI